MKQLVGYTPKGNKVTIVDFFHDSNTNDTADTFAICLTGIGLLAQFPIESLTGVHYEVI